MPTPQIQARSRSTAISASTAETTIVPANPNFPNLLTQLIVTTTNVVAGTLTLRDGTGGQTRAVFDYPNSAAVPSSTLVINFDPPLLQAQNANWTIQASANASVYNVTAAFVAGN